MSDRALFLAGAGAVLVLALIGWVAARKVAAITPPGAFNPLDDRNLAYKGANAVGAAITGDQAFSVGGAVWRLLNPGAAAVEDRIAVSSAPTVLDGFYAAPGDSRGVFW